MKKYLRWKEVIIFDNNEKKCGAMKVIRIIVWVLLSAFFVLGLIYYFTGSLEMMPTPEQQEKARTVAIVMMVVPMICGVIMFFTRPRPDRRNENQITEEE